MQKPVIACDSDGVVYDLETRWWEWYRENYDDVDTDITIEQMFRSWNVHENVAIGKQIYEAFDETEFFTEGDGYPGQMQWLKKINDVSELYIVTCCSGRGQAAMDKMWWWKDSAPFLNIKHQFVLLHDKWRFQADIFIDDKLETLNKVQEVNRSRFLNPVRCFYVRRLHGSKDVIEVPYIDEITSLKQVYDYVQK